MTRRSVAGSLALFLAPCLVLTALSRPASADGTHCPKTTFCRPKAPCIKFKCVCPKPVCDPCSLENFGYYPTCWHTWPFPPNYAHCDVPTTTMLVPPSCGANGGVQASQLHVAQELPSPSGL